MMQLGLDLTPLVGQVAAPVGAHPGGELRREGAPELVGHQFGAPTGPAEDEGAEAGPHEPLGDEGGLAVERPAGRWVAAVGGGSVRRRLRVPQDDRPPTPWCADWSPR